MSQYDNTNRGALHKNTRRDPGDSKPDYTGSLNVDGVEFFLDAWINTSKEGNKYMSVKVKRKDKQAGAPAPAPAYAPAPQRQVPAAAGSGFGDMSDDIPF